MTGLWDKALAAAEDARSLFGSDRYDAAVNRAYYAMFSAARTLLILRGLKADSLKRHASVLRRFSADFVKNGPFGADDGHALRLAGDARVVADYDDVPVTRAKAEDVLASMERFIRLATSVVADIQGGRPESV
jgi:uncharacterized protein (UPF0332 family)